MAALRTELQAAVAHMQQEREGQEQRIRKKFKVRWCGLGGGAGTHVRAYGMGTGGLGVHWSVRAGRRAGGDRSGDRWRGNARTPLSHQTAFVLCLGAAEPPP